MITALEKRSGITVRRYVASIPRAIRGISDGDYDLIISGAKTNAFKETTSLAVLGCSRLEVVTRQDADINTLSDLKDRKIGFVTGGFLLKKFGHKFGMRPVLANTSASMIRMLLASRVEGIFISDLIFDTYWLTEIPFSNISPRWRLQIGNVLEAEVVSVHLRIVNRSKFVNLSSRLTKAAKQAVEDGAVEKVYRKYGIRSGGKC